MSSSVVPLSLDQTVGGDIIFIIGVAVPRWRLGALGARVGDFVDDLPDEEGEHIGKHGPNWMTFGFRL